MNSTPDPQRPPESSATRAANLGYAVIAGQGGCFTLAIIIIALLVGIWLDGQMGTRGPFTIGMLLLSIPFSLFVMVRIALGSIGRITPPRPKSQQNQEENR